MSQNLSKASGPFFVSLSRRIPFLSNEQIWLLDTVSLSVSLKTNLQNRWDAAMVGSRSRHKVSRCFCSKKRCVSCILTKDRLKFAATLLGKRVSWWGNPRRRRQSCDSCVILYLYPSQYTPLPSPLTSEEDRSVLYFLLASYGVGVRRICLQQSSQRVTSGTEDSRENRHAITCTQNKLVFLHSPMVWSNKWNTCIIREEASAAETGRIIVELHSNAWLIQTSCCPTTVKLDSWVEFGPAVSSTNLQMFFMFAFFFCLPYKT